MAKPILVSDGPSPETSRSTYYSEDNQEILSRRMVCINEARHKSGLTDAATLDYIARSTRKGT
jgi:hypothetical protein